MYMYYAVTERRKREMKKKRRNLRKVMYVAVEKKQEGKKQEGCGMNMPVCTICWESWHKKISTNFDKIAKIKLSLKMFF